MPAPIDHLDTASLMGSWPVIPEFVTGTPVFDSRVIDRKATILGVKKETSAGYNVDTKSLYIWVDGTQHQVSFSGTDPFTLDEVIDVFNNVGGSKGSISPAPSGDIAFRDNGFLRLVSPSSVGGGSLRLQTDTDPDLFVELGLFSETEAFDGQIKQTQHFDPDRQVALPRQMSMGDGEDLRSDVINRALFQLGINTERNEGLLSRKRMAVQKNIDVGSWPGGSTGYQFIGDEVVYTGAATGPSVSDLESYFAVLDADGREYVKRFQDVLTTSTVDFVSSQDRQEVQVQAGPGYVAGDEKGEVYIISSAGSLPAALQGVPMKILEVESGGALAVVQPIDPVTGDVVLFNAAGVSADRVEIQTRRCVVDEVRKPSTTTRVEGVQTTKESGTPTRIDKNNRIVVSGALFKTNSVGPVVEGDLVVWSSYVGSDPYTNNGNYRVSKVVDEETIEVVAEDWGPVYLNPDLSGGAGTVTVSTDGEFYKEPFLHFLPEASGGAIPTTGDAVRIVYLGMSTFREITDDPSSFSGGSVRYKQEADDYTQQVLLAIIGPSATTLTEYMHDDARNSLENLDYRVNFEHYPADTLDASGSGETGRQGRHKDIRPDKIYMWEDITGETVRIFNSGTDDGTSAIKATLRDGIGNVRFSIHADGSVSINHPDSSGANTLLNMLGNADATNPYHWAWVADVDNKALRLDVDNDGAGGTFDGAFIADWAGRVGMNQIPGTGAQLYVTGRNGNVAIIGQGGDSAGGIQGYGGATASTPGVYGEGGPVGGVGVSGKGGGTPGFGIGTQGEGTGGDPGVRGFTGTAGGIGVQGFGSVSAAAAARGIDGLGGGLANDTASEGVYGEARLASNSAGVHGLGGGGTASYGLWGQARAGSAASGVRGEGDGIGVGVEGFGGTSGVGVQGIGGGGAAGVAGISSGPTAAGVTGSSLTNDGYGVYALGKITAPDKASLRIKEQEQPVDEDVGAMYVDKYTKRPSLGDGTDWIGFMMNSYQASSLTDDIAGPPSGAPWNIDFATTYTIPANSLKVGSVVRIRAWGKNTGASINSVYHYRIAFGAFEICHTSTSSPSSADKDSYSFSLESLVLFTVVGAGGAASSIGTAIYGTGVRTSIDEALVGPARETFSIPTNADILIKVSLVDVDATPPSVTAADTSSLYGLVVDISG